MSEMKASKVGWGRLVKVLLGGTAVLTVGTLVVMNVTNGGLILNADGLVTRDRVFVATPYEARVREVFVRPGDWVEAGQKVAVVESASIAKALAEFSVEKAKITSRLATLSSRTDIIKSMLPLAESGMKQANEFMGNLNRANAQGLTVNKSLYEVSAAAFTASERMITLKSESASLNSELETNRSVLKEITTASNNLQKVYNGGVLTAPVSGIVGSTIAAPGEVMGSSSSKVASIYTGTSFVLAYMPESYLFDVEAGQPVVVKSRGSNVVGHIEAVLPVSDALPPEFQAPSKARDRGQVVKITLEDTSRLAVEQKIRVTSCYVTGCKTSYTEQAWQRAPVLYREAKAYIETNAPIYYGRARSYVASLDIPTKVSKGYQTAAVTTKKWIDSLSGSPAEASPDQPRIAKR